MDKFPHRAIVHRAIVHKQTASGQFIPQLAQCEPRCSHPGPQPNLIFPLDLARHMATDLAGGHAPRRAKPLRPLHHSRSGHAQRLPNIAHSLAGSKPRHRATTKVNRERFHPESWPPHPAFILKQKKIPSGIPRILSSVIPLTAEESHLAMAISKVVTRCSTDNCLLPAHHLRAPRFLTVSALAQRFWCLEALSGAVDVVLACHEVGSTSPLTSSLSGLAA